MNLVISGKEEEIIFNGEKFSITELLKIRKVEMPDMVSVEINGTIISRKDYDTTPVSDGDSVEFLYFMGGGEKEGLIA